MSWKNVSKIKGSKWDLPCFMTYVLSFPDGDQWVKQTQMTMKSLDMHLKNMIAEHSQDKKGRSMDWKNRAMALWKAGECWWKDNLGVEHLILIEAKKRPSHQLKWGVSKKNMGTITHGVDEHGNKPKNKIIV